MPSPIMPAAMPEQMGVRSASLSALLTAIETEHPAAIHGMQILRHGHTILDACWKPYTNNCVRTMMSLTKTLTSLAIGLLMDDGKLKLEDHIVDFFPKEAARYRLDPRMKDMTVHHLLTMNAGFPENISGCGTWSQRSWNDLKTFLELPLVYAPGERFVYNSGAAHMCSMLVTRLAGESEARFVQRRLFDPLGIHDVIWDADNLGNSTGGWGSNLSLNDMSRIGQLLLNNGVWEGRRLISGEYLRLATAPQVRSAPRSFGANHYGYFMWIDPGESFALNGAFGQLVVVYPKCDMVISLQMANSDDAQSRTNAFVYGTEANGGKGYFDRFLFCDLSDEPLAENAGGQAALRDQIAALDIGRMAYNESPAEKSIGSHVYEMAENTQGISRIALSFSEDAVTYSQIDESGTHSICCGKGAWRDGTTDMTGKVLHHNRVFDPMKVSGLAFWEDADTLILRWAFLQMPFVDTVRIRYVGQKILVRRSVNISTPNTNNGATSLPTIWGSAID